MYLHAKFREALGWPPHVNRGSASLPLPVKWIGGPHRGVCGGISATACIVASERVGRLGGNRLYAFRALHPKLPAALGTVRDGADKGGWW